MARPKKEESAFLLSAMYEVNDMSMQETIARINELARKAKSEGLTPEEIVERDKLRRIYIDAYKASLVGQLENTYLVDEKGNKRKLGSKE